MYGIRPWKGYQAHFVEALLALSEDGGGRRGRCRKADQGVARLQAPGRATWRLPKRPPCPGAPRSIKKINQELVPKILALNDPFQEVRSHIGALTYEIEVTHSESSKDSLRKEIEELKEEKHEVKLPGEGDRSAAWISRPCATSCRPGRTRRRNCCSSAWSSDEAGHGAARQARSVSLRPHRRRQHRDHRGRAEFARQVRYPHPPDSREGCRSGGPLRELPPGNARAGDAHQGRHGRRGRLHQPSEQGTAEDPRSRAIRLHALPRRQRRGAFQRGEGARL